MYQEPTYTHRVGTQESGNGLPRVVSPLPAFVY